MTRHEELRDFTPQRGDIFTLEQNGKELLIRVATQTVGANKKRSVYEKIKNRLQKIQQIVNERNEKVEAQQGISNCSINQCFICYCIFNSVTTIYISKQSNERNFPPITPIAVVLLI